MADIAQMTLGLECSPEVGFPDSDSLMALLEQWQQVGWIRALDRALARFLQQQGAEEPAVLWLATLLSHQLGRGHLCLDLTALWQNPRYLLALPPEHAPADLPTPSALLNALTREQARQALQRCPLVDSEGRAGGEPLVLEGDRLYLRRYWNYEVEVADALRQRATTLQPELPDLRQRLDHLFGSTGVAGVDWQQVAVALASRRALTVISGGPGTGKTTTVVRLLGLLQGAALERGERLQIRLAAPTGKAAARLTESIAAALDSLPSEVRGAIPHQVTTLHRLLGPLPDSRRFRHHADNPLHLDLLVVDEASMVDLEMMAQLLAALPPHARLVLLGDKDQLASVEAGAVLGDLCMAADQPGYPQAQVDWLQQHIGYALPLSAERQAPVDQSVVLLRHSYRFDANSGIGTLARAVNAGDAAAVEAIWQQGFADIRRYPLRQLEALCLAPDEGGDSHWYSYRHYLQCLQAQRVAGEPTPAALEGWAQAVLKAFGHFQLLCALRQGPFGVEAVNRQVEAALQREGLIEAGSLWYEGRPVLVTRNDYALGLMNGDIGIALWRPALADQPAGLRVVFSDGQGGVRWVLPARLNSVETVFAMTVHKSQGSEFVHTALLLPDHPSPVLTRELIYTGITRARQAFTLLSPSSALLNQGLAQRVYRSSGLAERLRHAVA